MNINSLRICVLEPLARDLTPREIDILESDVLALRLHQHLNTKYTQRSWFPPSSGTFSISPLIRRQPYRESSCRLKVLSKTTAKLLSVSFSPSFRRSTVRCSRSAMKRTALD